MLHSEIKIRACTVQLIKKFVTKLASLMVRAVKNLLEMQETWLSSLGWKDPLENGMATHSSLLAW